MKKFLSVLLIGFMVFSVLPVATAFADDEVHQENTLDKMSDWAKTAGKDKGERDRILTQRKAERERQHAEKKAARMKDKVAPEAAMPEESLIRKGKMKSSADERKAAMKAAMQARKASGEGGPGGNLPGPKKKS
ncbi:MAG: hypothetical protein Q8R76_08735 [Candidatus Omnitrophota bacterium]|nr:hypothetical protein [Candidatus Omnitrophota bacterium]